MCSIKQLARPLVLLLVAATTVVIAVAVWDGLDVTPQAAPVLAAPTKPDNPIETKLTIKQASPPLTQAGNEGQDLHVFLASTAPFTGTVEAVDEGGQRVATIQGLKLEDCPEDATTLYTGTGSGEWCLHVSGLQDGAEMTGIIPTDDVILTLAFSVRDNFIGLPLLVVVLGFLTASVWLWWTSKELEIFVAQRFLAGTIDANEHADPKAKIEGLGEWVDRLRSRYSAKSLFQMVDTMLRFGPAQAAAAKTRLTKAIADADLGAGHPMVVAAEGAVALMHVGDFYDETGKQVDVHPADKWAASIIRAKSLYARLEQTYSFVDRFVPDGDRRTRFHSLLDYARARLEKADKEEALTEAEADLDEIRHQAFEAAAAEAPPDRGEGFGPSVIQEVPATATEALVETDLSTRLLLSRAAILATVGLFAVLAAITVASATYLPNATFGLWSDYLGLFIAIIAASSITGAISALGVWTLRKPLA